MASSSSGASSSKSDNEHILEEVEIAVNTQVGSANFLPNFDNTQHSEDLEDSPSNSIPPKTFSSPSTMSPVVAPASSFSSPQDYNRNPYTETDYAPKRFRPQEPQDEGANDAKLVPTVSSTSTTWLPPDYTDEQLTTLNSPVAAKKTPNSADEYTGPVLGLDQLPSLTMYGYPRGDFHSSKMDTDLADLSPVEDKSPLSKTSSTSRRMNRHRSPGSRELVFEAREEVASRGSFGTSSTGTHSNSTAPLSNSITASSTFAIRAKQAGIPDWNEKLAKGLVGNNSVFDGRWVLNPDEAWNVLRRKQSALTVSPISPHSVFGSNVVGTEESDSPPKSRPSIGDEQSSQETLSPIKGPTLSASKSDHAGSEEFQINKQDSQDVTGSRRDVEDSLAELRSSMETGSRDISEAIETQRLRQYVADLSMANGDLRGMLQKYEPANIRKIFCERVFDNPNPEPPQGEAAAKAVRYQDRDIAYSDLYLYLLGEINEIVAYMTAPTTKKSQEIANSPISRRIIGNQQTPKFIGDQASRQAAYDAGSSTNLHDSGLESITQSQDSPSRGREVTGNEKERKGLSNLQIEEYPKLSRSSMSFQKAHPDMHRAQTSSVQPIQHGALRLPQNIANSTSNRTLRPAFQNLPLMPDIIDTNCGVREENAFITATAGSEYRMQTRLGDPATAEFNPTANNLYPSADRQAPLFSSPANPGLNANILPPGLPINLQALQGDQSDFFCGNSGLKQSYHSRNNYTDPQATSLQQATVATRPAFEQSTNVSSVPPHFGLIQNEYSSTVQSPPVIGRSGNSLQGNKKAYLSSQSTIVERPFQDMTLLNTNVHAPQVDHSQYKSQLLIQAQAGTHTPAELLNDYHAEHFVQDLNFNGPIGQFQNQRIPSIKPERYPLIAPPPGFTLPPFAMASAPNFGLSKEPVHNSSEQNQTWAPLNSYEHKIHSSYTQAPTHEMHKQGPSSAILAYAPPGYPYAPSVNAELPPSPFHSAATGGTSSSYVQPYIPADKYARAPAPNRLASRYSQVPPFQPLQIAGPFNIPNPPQSRFSAPALSPRASLMTLPYHSGSNEMFPNQRPGMASVRYQDLTRHEPPRFEIAGNENYRPFVETTKLSKPAGWGVLKISNMPYDITRKLLHQFLGPHAKTITSDLGPCIHIMMDRSTGKTQDCYVEFFSAPDANAWRAVIARRSPHQNKIGERILEVETSSQEELLKELFPKARCVAWNGPDGPQIKETEEAFDSGFKGFIAQEELKGLIHHAEQPHRSVYTQKCPPRPYANMISILSKFPWHATAHYTLFTRNILFNATFTLVKTLVNFLRRSSSLTSQGHRTNPSQDSNSSGIIPFPAFSATSSSNMFRPDLSQSELSKLDMREKGLNEGLLKELVLAGLNAYGFSDSQRYQLYLSASPVLGRDWIGLSPLMSKWPFEVVGRKAGYEEDVVEFYAHLLSSHPDLATHPAGPAMSHHSTQPQMREYLDLRMPFGNFSNELYAQNVEGYAQQSVSIEALGQWEMNVITEIVRGMCLN